MTAVSSAISHVMCKLNLKTNNMETKKGCGSCGGGMRPRPTKPKK